MAEYCRIEIFAKQRDLAMLNMEHASVALVIAALGGGGVDNSSIFDQHHVRIARGESQLRKSVRFQRKLANAATTGFNRLPNGSYCALLTY